MLAIVILTALLGLAEASWKTPRTAYAYPSSSSSSTSTLATAMPQVTAPSGFISPSRLGLHGFNASSNGVAATGTGTILPLHTHTPASASASASASNPQITPSPELNPPGGNFHEIGGGLKYVQTTYWSCVTFPLETHCGWHEPILDAGAGRIGCNGGQAALRAGVVAGVVAGGLVLGI
ncbi:hypothetical protein M426DRAFT_14954 [Hypoxylon sp. CI-4A]|nr:hypothetical protein M426DRAFT_14954 [Hypoxylon sp. CI-4A]